MAVVVGRKLSISIVSCLVAACSDDTSEAVTGIGSATEAESTFGSFTDTFESVSDTVVDETFGEAGPEVTSVSTFETSDTVMTTDSDLESSVSITDSDTFDTSITDSDSDTQGSTSTSEGTSTTSMTDSDPSTTSTTTDPSTTDPSTTDSSTTSTTDPSATDPSTTTDPSATDPTDPSTTTDPTGGGGFPPAPAFGTNILDFDLVGVWGLNWDPATGFDSVIDIDDQGNFMWTESSADCSSETLATGYLWVEGIQIVMHVETWERQLPWDTVPVTGETYPPPFRLRMSFSLQGSGADDYLVLAAPSRITETTPYTGESYVQIVVQGDFLAGTWHGESQLDAIPEGEVDPVVIVRDTYEALLDLEMAADDPQGTGTRAVTTQYFPVAQQFQSFDGGNWTCLDGCPDPAGLTLVDGSNLYTYGPYASYEHLLTFETGRTFRRDAASDCP